jgi:hypothetical protein
LRHAKVRPLPGNFCGRTAHPYRTDNWQNPQLLCVCSVRARSAIGGRRCNGCGRNLPRSRAGRCPRLQHAADGEWLSLLRIGRRRAAGGAVDLRRLSVRTRSPESRRTIPSETACAVASAIMFRCSAAGNVSGECIEPVDGLLQRDDLLNRGEFLPSSTTPTRVRGTTTVRPLAKGCRWLTCGVSAMVTVRLPCATGTVDRTSRPMTMTPERSSITIFAAWSGSTCSCLSR